MTLRTGRRAGNLYSGLYFERMADNVFNNTHFVKMPIHRFVTHHFVLELNEEGIKGRILDNGQSM